MKLYVKKRFYDTVQDTVRGASCRPALLLIDEAGRTAISYAGDQPDDWGWTGDNTNVREY